MPGDRVMGQILAQQDYLTTVVEQSAAGYKATVTGSMIDFFPPGDPTNIERLADPSIRIVSLTVTEGGYFINPATGEFDPDQPALKQDVANPETPTTAFGLILAGLRTRLERGIAPFTVMSCDNLLHNGNVTRNAVVGLAEMQDSKLAAWVEREVAFPNGMVDRITPVTSDRERTILQEEFGIEDGWPVFCENYIQWVLEDYFPLGRPELETVGVTFVPDVTPYEHMKLRILNAGHASIAYVGALLDQHFVHEAMAHPLICRYLEKLETEEILPSVPPVPNTDLQAYLQLILERFANPKIGDTIARLCFDGSNRQPKFVLPSTRDRLQAGDSVTGLALESALWCRYWGGLSEGGQDMQPEDSQADRLRTLAERSKTEPLAFLELQDVFGDLSESKAFQQSFQNALQHLWQRGTANTLQRYLDDQL
jgi:mannitol 2-dehydrogenase